MNAPLDIVRDKQGRLRDVNDQPMIIIFDSKPRTSRRSHSAKTKTKSAVSQSFAFINATKPSEEDEDARKLIRTHVMRGRNRQGRQKSNSASSTGSPTLTGNDISYEFSPPLVIPSQASALGPALINFPIQMQPYMHRLLHQYASSLVQSMDPQLSDPKYSAWFPMVMTDPALFHAVLCLSAIYGGLLSGEQDSIPQRKHMLEATSIMNIRLQRSNTMESVSDATITTILFIAKAENAQENYTNWDIHMNGLKRIVEVRGGVVMVPSFLRQKIYHDEITGCIETGSNPRFPFVDGCATIGPSIAPPSLPPAFQSLTQNNSLEENLVNILYEIETLSNSLEISPSAVRELEPMVINVRYRLLSWKDQQSAGHSSVVRQSLRLGAILYIETLFRTASVRAVNYTAVLSNLQKQVLELTTIPTATGLLLWLLFIGGSAFDGSYRTWFAASLLDATVRADIKTWDAAKQVLVRHWWIDSIHDSPCQQLWDESQRSSSLSPFLPYNISRPYMNKNREKSSGILGNDPKATVNKPLRG